jgi:tRNA1(Val) A37 N6-methylase TrmN6
VSARSANDGDADGFLGGRLTIRQPRGGFRSGLDAVMLAAAVPADAAGDVLELGAGAGVASLCVAARVAGATSVGVEIDPALVALAGDNARENGLEARVRFVEGDVLSLPSELRRDFAHVIANPPFHDGAGLPPPDAGRRRALHDAGRLADWLSVGVRRTMSGGTFTTILRADRLAEALAVLPVSGVVALPLWPRAGEPAMRIVLQTRKGSRAPFILLPGLVLHTRNGAPTADAEAVLRDGGSLALARPRL